MNIVHTEASCGWGGQEIRILTETKGMIARGHEVHLLCPAESRIFSEAQSLAIPVTALPISRKSLRGYFALRRWLKQNPATEVINTHSSTDSWLTALACATLKSPPPIIRTRHVSSPIPHNMATRWLYCKATRHIVTTGRKLQQTLIHENGFPAAQISSVPTGIDTSFFTPGKRENRHLPIIAPTSGIIIGIVATLRSWKGHRYLIDAFSRLPPHFADAVLVIIGDGPQRDALNEQIQTLKLEERVIMAGNQRDVLPWFRALDIFVLPSYANEGIPQALMQAMACGLPCITTQVGSIGELARHQKTALIVPPKDIPNLVEALIRLGNDTNLRTSLGRTARSHCAANFDQQKMLNAMERVFTKVINRSLSKS